MILHIILQIILLYLLFSSFSPFCATPCVMSLVLPISSPLFSSLPSLSSLLFSSHLFSCVTLPPVGISQSNMPLTLNNPTITQLLFSLFSSPLISSVTSPPVGISQSNIPLTLNNPTITPEKCPIADTFGTKT